MKLDQAHHGDTNAMSEAERRHRSLVRRILVWSIVLTLPVTSGLLWLLSGIQMWPEEIDIMGLLAISVGILGVFIFFMLLYRFQTGAICSRRRRWGFLFLHTGIVLVLFLFTIWLGYDSPWRSLLIWGNYDMLSAVKPWIISVLVIGSITLLGVMVDIVRKGFEQRWREDRERGDR
jgi:hypothetical protein